MMPQVCSNSWISCHKMTLKLRHLPEQSSTLQHFSTNNFSNSVSSWS
uniref:Uncharacterized protein n=1 Tax=Rhizophora mucronata TaxID=61149 RepID=A0A2P2Q025_RHIMU